MDASASRLFACAALAAALALVIPGPALSMHTEIGVNAGEEATRAGNVGGALPDAAGVAAIARQGTITGTVADQSTREPLRGAQVQVMGAQLGTVTDGQGQFTIAGVPAGTHTVQVTYLGYRTATEEVSVVAGQTEQLNFHLAISAIALDQIVVTGTGGEVERSRVGASIATLDVGRIQDLVPIENLGTALQARIPGLRSVGTAGGVGAARLLQVRGRSSFQLNQRPVVYIDGVRVDTRATEWGAIAGGTCCSVSGDAGTDRLSDLNPSDIERVEVLKGAAATTLYGSEATNGVIQIFTRRGSTATPARWTVQLNSGFNRHRPNFPTTLWPNFTGPDGTRALDANQELIETGMLYGADVTVAGGSDNITYFVSGAYSDEEGSIKPNFQKRANVRSNVRFMASDAWSFEVASAYSRNQIHDIQSGNNWMSLLGNAILGNPRQATAEEPFGEPWIPISNIKQVETLSQAGRFTGSLTTTFQPRSNLTNRFTFGLDHVNDERSRHIPFGAWVVYLGDVGEKMIGYRNFQSYTADYLGQLSFDLSPTLSSELSWGGQGFWEIQKINMARGEEFAGPGVTTVRGAARTQADETFSEVINLGFYAQNRFSFLDKFFVTGGVRVDGNSAFGVNYGFEVYPKVDASYVMSDEPWLPGLFSSLRVRGAVGMSGMAPGAFDQFATFSPFAALEDEAAVRPNNPGNPDLRPERTREIEAGFEAGFLDDRLGVDFSAYHALTSQALLPIAQPPSSGRTQSQLQNVGELLNKGWEVSLNASLVEGSGFRWYSTLNLDSNTNEILDLGPTAEWNEHLQTYELGGRRVGYAVGSMFDRVVASYDPETRTHTRTDEVHFIGNPTPKNTASIANTLEFGSFRIYGLVSAEKGEVFSNGDRPYRIRFLTGDEYLSTLDENWEPTMVSDSLLNFFTLFNAWDKRDQVRIREVSLSYQVSERVADRMGLGRTTVTLSGQNLHWWDKCNCMDPNIQYIAGSNTSGSGFLAMPRPRRFIASIRTTF